MSQTTPSTQARLAFWVSPEHADDFNAQITRTLTPILKKLGFTRTAPNPRREIEGVCSRLLTLTHSDDLDTIQHQLTTDADWVAKLKELSALYAPSSNEEISYRITAYKVSSPAPHFRHTGAGYHEGAWHTLGVRDGLPSSLIKQVLQSQDGSLWLCTHENGICHFDGRRFSSYVQQTGLPSNLVYFLLVDREKLLWCATEKGVCRFDGNVLETFTIEDGLAEDQTLSEDGVLYGCDGEDLYAMSLQDGQFKWKFNINKDGKAGKITGDKAWAVDVEKSSYSIMGTKTTTTTWSNPRRILRTDYRDSHFIVYGDKKIIRVNKKDGKMAWDHEWKYDPNQKHLLFDPTYVGANDDIVYACKGFYGIDGKTGEIKWEDKDVEGEYTQVSDDLLVVRKKDKVRGYSLK